MPLPSIVNVWGIVPAFLTVIFPPCARLTVFGEKTNPPAPAFTVAEVAPPPPAGGEGACGALLGGVGQQVDLVLGVWVVHGPDGHERPRLGGVASRRLEDLGVLQAMLQLADAALHQGLLVLGRLVLGVLADVAQLACV